MDALRKFLNLEFIIDFFISISEPVMITFDWTLSIIAFLLTWITNVFDLLISSFYFVYNGIMTIIRWFS